MKAHLVYMHTNTTKISSRWSTCCQN